MQAHKLGLTGFGLGLALLYFPFTAAASGGGSGNDSSSLGNAQLETSAQRGAARLFDFDIPVLPLSVAMDRFAVLSGRSTLYNSALTEGRTSSPVHGRYTSLQALRLLLEGTGLMAEEVVAGQVGALVVKPISPQAQEGMTTSAAVQKQLLAYDSLLQARVWAALCTNPQTAQHDYQSLVRFEVTEAGQIYRVQLLGTSGDRHRDAALLETLGRIQLDRPPLQFGQPVTLLILPHLDGASACRAGAG